MGNKRCIWVMYSSVLRPSFSPRYLSSADVSTFALVHRVVCMLLSSSLVFVTLFVCFFLSELLCIMVPKHDLSGKDTPPGKKQARKTIMLEQKVDIIRRYDNGKSTNSIRNASHLPESTVRTIRKDREKILAAFKAGAGGASTRVSSGQSTFMVRLRKC